MAMSIDFKRVFQKGPASPTGDVEIVRVHNDRHDQVSDRVAVEEPLEIRLGFTFLGKPAQRSISVTMRTPGHDRELAAGFLFGEGVISSADDIVRIEYCGESDGERSPNIIRVELAAEVDVDMASVQRNFYTTSSCGVCGKASLEALEIDDCSELPTTDFSIPGRLVSTLPNILRTAQPVFDETGGIHAAGLFDCRGELLTLREDVGRHNAMDKLVGARLLDGMSSIAESVVVLSGRASFELLQKALRAQIPIVIAVGAPSSLAIDLAERFGITLAGFARGERFNIYSHPGRIDI